MREITLSEKQEVNGGVVFLIPPAVTATVKAFGIGIGIIAGSIGTYAAYRTIKPIQ